jgi:hypothetical protein
MRVTLECPECALPIPVNGVVPSVFCHGCHEVVQLDGPLGWRSIATYADGEGCMEHRVLVSSGARSAIDYFLAFEPSQTRRLYRRYQGILLEIDEAAPKCLKCRAPLDAEALLSEAMTEREPDGFCGACGAVVPIRRATREDREVLHKAVAAIVNETAPRGDVREKPTTEAVLFSCMGCGAPLEIDGEVPRISTCKYCESTNFLPDALWLRLHPAQRKQPFHLLLRVSEKARVEAMKRVR